MMSGTPLRLRGVTGSQFTGGSNVTNSLTDRCAGLVLGGGASLILMLALALGATGVTQAQAQAQAPAQTQAPAAGPEPVPEPVIEPGENPPAGVTLAADPEPVIEPGSEDAEPAASATPVVDPPSRVARLGYIDGDVTVAPAGTDDWAEAVLNRPLTSGDRLWVERGGRAELQIGASAIYLDGDTGFGFLELDDDVLQASLTEGMATVRVRRLAEGETVQVETPHSTVLLKRVGEYHFEVDKSADRTIVKTRSGEAEVRGANQNFTVRDNERGVFTGMETLSGRIEPLGPRTAFESWANERDARNERSKSAQYVSRDVIGYEDLDDHGEWISEPEYGYVWRPTYVSHNWAPYRFGRWAYVSPWGWTWIDDARWGFAPFHYGRWAHIRNRWCWVPGPRHIRPVYAPALVGWLGGPRVSVSVSFGHVGWFPLGPRDIFYPGYYYTPHYIRYVNVSNTYFITHNHFYGRRLHPPRYDFLHHPGAVTSVSREHFVGGRRIGDHWVRLDGNQLRNYHAERRPPAIAPYRESVLAAPIRRPPRNADGFQWRHGDTFAGRVPFHRERRAIELNGGRPIGRNQLVNHNGPKRGGDFHVVRPGSVGIGPGVGKRPDRDRALGLNRNDRRVRELNNDSVREWQSRRDRGNNESRPGRTLSTVPSSQARDLQRERREAVEIMRAEERPRSESMRRDHMQRPPSVNSLQQQRGTASFYTPPPSNQFRDRERSRSTGGTIGRSAPQRFTTPPPSEPRTYTPPRSEPRQLSQPRQYTPPSQPRQYTPPSQPRQYTPPSQPRQYSPPRQSSQPRSAPAPRAAPRASSSSSNRGGATLSRPRSTSRER